MAVKNTTQVLIGGKIVTLSGYESEEYLQKVANYMNNKLTELGQLPGYNRQALETRHTLLSLNIADDYFKAKRQAEMYEEELEAKDREMYDLKHDLINGHLRYLASAFRAVPVSYPRPQKAVVVVDFGDRPHCRPGVPVC